MITAIRSGGQTGVDRGALDAARAAGVPLAGWCPSGGWAEDRPTPPGLLPDYPELAETPSAETGQRTGWNVRDSDVTIILTAGDGASPGTELTAGYARRWGRPHLVLDAGAWGQDGPATAAVTEALPWLRCLGGRLGGRFEVNIAGPRASEWDGAYAASYTFVAALLGIAAR
ncbi:putative molybdenum carrier protein [Corynebacterium sp.]|uniref:putative molybdenum carrier protein n=1 Tax=Corynebacterium sp. TaxID=1720 RepID=UPI0025B8430D|nr:putative molybdenum carrier protein [Corynebacterium sp.]